MSNCTWKKINGRYVCEAKECIHWIENGGCKLGKISHTCDNNDCIWNICISPGVYASKCMEIHLDADGKCLGKE